MPEEVTVATNHAIVGHVADAIVKSFVGRKETRVPVKMTLLGASWLRLGADDFRTIVSSVQIDGQTIYTVSSSSSADAEAAWRRLAELDEASRHLDRVRTILRPLSSLLSSRKKNVCCGRSFGKLLDNCC